MNNELSVGKEQWSDADESSLDVWTAEEEGMFSKNVSGHVSHQRLGRSCVVGQVW